MVDILSTFTYLYNSNLLRHFHQPLLFHIPPLNRLRKMIQHLKRRHSHTSLLSFSQRLAQQILKLDEIALIIVSTRTTDSTFIMLIKHANAILVRKPKPYLL